MSAEIAAYPPSRRARAAWRRTRALELASEGRPWDDIAREVGYTNRGTAHATMMRALNARTAEAVDDHRALEVDRLDALQAALWEKAMSGNAAAAEAVRRIIADRCRVLGLVPSGLASSRSNAEPKTVVLGPPQAGAAHHR